MFVSFKVTSSNDRVLCVYALLGYRTRKQLTREHFFEELQNYMENKNKEHKYKITLGDFDCTIDKMYRDCGNKKQRTYKFRSNYPLSKLIVDNGLENL